MSFTIILFSILSVYLIWQLAQWLSQIEDQKTTKEDNLIKLNHGNQLSKSFEKYKEKLKEKKITELMIYRFKNSLYAEYTYSSGRVSVSEFSRINSNAHELITLTKHSEGTSKKTEALLFKQSSSFNSLSKPTPESELWKDKLLSVTKMKPNWTWYTFINQEFLSKSQSDITVMLEDIIEEVIDKAPDFSEKLSEWDIN